ncbi:Cytochrome P450 2E1 [Hypsibius exemplaris]|uniref:Cytochrome P450 2E1 n=1 Tax=Hypsibius exemplaris TaxID=2072580 RepID=A0A1W0WN37_HYPEX|nr:Cytochrome P450 2E1 [Hypsibius exemplaris]
MSGLQELSVVNCLITLAVSGLALLFFSCSGYFERLLDRWRGRVPPGPLVLPVIGAVGVDPLRPEQTFRKWAAQYGSMFSFFLGDRFCIGVSDLNVIRRLFKDERFTNRSQAGIIRYLDGEPLKGIIMGHGGVWKEHRRFTLTALRDFGFGRVSGAEYIHREESSLLTAFRDKNGQPFDPKMLFATAVSNVISCMLFTSELKPGDARFAKFVAETTTLMANFVASGAMEVYPWLRHFPPFSRRLKELNARHMENIGLLAEMVQDHKKSFDSDHPRDYIDAFFCVQEERRKRDADEGTFTDAQLVRNLADVFIAGYETTSTYLRWSMVYMILHPEVQRKVQAEIDAYIGNSRLPNLADKAKLPYTDAVTIEIHRICYFVPFSVPHAASEDVEFEGYLIPKGTEIWPLVCHHFMNPDVWGDPEVFRPERFIDATGNLIGSLVDEVQPFSSGRRACIGEPLARMEVFGFFAAILQHFTLSSEVPPSRDSTISAVRAPLPFTMIATPRV